MKSYRLMDKKRTYFLALATLCLIALFLFLGESSFHTRGEPREAVVAFSMLERGNWILPVNNGVDIAYKPPLFHWMIAATSSLVGSVSEYTARFPSALALTVMILAGFLFFAKRRGTELAMVASLLTLTNFEVHRAGLNCRVDMLLAAFMVLALYQLYFWYERNLKGIPWLAILFMGGAALTKGPVGIVVPCLVAFVFLLIKGKKFLPLCGKFIVVGLLSCVLPLVWYIAAYQQGGERFLALFLEENFLRFAGKMSYASHENPAYYNVLTLLAGFIPYTLFVVISLFFLKYKKPDFHGLWSRTKAAIASMDDTRLYALVSAAVIFIFYCIPKSKRSVYLLPMYPFVAYFLAEYFLYLRRKHPGVIRVSTWILAILSTALFLVFVVVRLGLIPESWIGGRHPEETWAYIEALRTAPLDVWNGLLILLPFGILADFIWRLRRRAANLLPTLFGFVITVFIALDGFYQPTVLNVKSDKPMAQHIATLVPDGRLYSYRKNFVEGNRMHPFTLNFYLGDRIVPFQDFAPTEGYLVMGENELANFQETYGTTYTLKDLYDSNRRSCDDHSVVHLYWFEKR